ncbi:ATP-dependent zinc metalloprotease FtsH [Riemerella anatipestifer]|uniref:ATP-dependent zinc metalloprotease FtsH n=1 Tax=Riemerella anatipestifer TaxID=34085 RepID=UPI0013730FF0|nr:ATP-dependent zinc metalloprotease FtsH [Riemerella anatipestifer]MBT0548930.1 ATP-dependent zinc metalloprotease FtsH [Riemerella anatipestifer]MBT0555244.1 ATP-dependent zinc metalloprotease FtsH [Riemerella anatipestifer]MBT0559693.1 ATP-dependent zinc metalloprotease FtsH [Riemerella anatipestifer]NAV15490.1 ATP-dependent metallopeptidase FtsH/Yme1/Tma family protein [Riemerella anatipestifer]UZX28804.1 ATP-dependent zinc metalloprotease FtsH [Riemerella anatipestifer]
MDKNKGFNWFYLLIFGALAVLFLPKLFSSSNTKTINEDEFFNMMRGGKVENLVLMRDSKEGLVFLNKTAKTASKGNSQADNPLMALQPSPDFKFAFGDLQYFQQRYDAVKKEKPQIKTSMDFDDSESPMQSLLFQALFWIGIMFLFYFVIFRKMAGGSGAGGQIFNIGKSRAKLFDEKDKVQVTFKDVAGLEGAKEEVQEVVDFLKNAEKYTKLGGKIPKGVLLVGPPGTGKTLLAKAVAGEAKVPFFSLSGSDFVEMFVGVGASRVRDLFAQAKAKSPAIIFIDEIDAIGRARGRGALTGGNDERENTLNQLLTEMDGFGTDTNVIVMAATNRADILDKALMRAGRFDRSIYVDLPELHERKQIFNVHLAKIKLDNTVEVEFLAKQTPGFSGADIANVCNEAALVAARKGHEAVGKQDFLDAVDRIIGGLEKKNKAIKPSEKRRVAFHEAGHASISWLVEHAAPLLKVTIVPRGRSLGAAWYLPEERQLTTTEQMLDEMCATLGGRAAEQVVFGTISTGALSDLERVTKQAQAMVTIYGLNDKVGNISYYDSSGQQEYSFGKPYSEQTAKMIDEEISKIIEGQYQRAINILNENRDKLDALADKLLEKEVIFREDLEAIFGKRAWDPELTETPVSSIEEVKKYDEPVVIDNDEENKG